MKRRFIYPKGGEPFEVTPDYIPEPRAGHYVMGDIQPYKSMVDGSIIGSRSVHREHLRAHGCVEIGNETKHLFQRKPLQSPPGLKQTLIEVANAKLRYK